LQYRNNHIFTLTGVITHTWLLHIFHFHIHLSAQYWKVHGNKRALTYKQGVLKKIDKECVRKFYGMALLPEANILNYGLLHMNYDTQLLGELKLRITA
jgi:hypothetical protein